MFAVCPVVVVSPVSDGRALPCPRCRPASSAGRRRRVAQHRAGHAPRTAAARSQLGAGDGDHLDAGLAPAGRWSRCCARRPPPAAAPARACCCRRPTARARRSPGRARCRCGAPGRCPSASAAASRNGRRRRHLEHDVAVASVRRRLGGGHGVRPQRVGDVGVDHHLVDVDHRDDGVEVHGGPLLGDRHRQHGVRDAGRRTPAGRTARHRRAWCARRRRPRSTPGPSSSTSPPSTCSSAQPCIAGHAREAGVAGVDQLGQVRLPLAGGHRQAGDRDPVGQPHRRVAGEQQVRAAGR